MSTPSQVLLKAMTLRYAVALYMSSALGSGVLVLPGLAAQIAGPSSLVAWVALSLIQETSTSPIPNNSGARSRRYQYRKGRGS